MIMTLRGKTPRISEEAFAAGTASIIGDVTVGRDSSVWFGAVIRGDNSPITVGEGTSIQDNAVLHTEPGHPLTVGNNVTVGHGAVVHCSAVGDNGEGAVFGGGLIALDPKGMVLDEYYGDEEKSITVDIGGKLPRDGPETMANISYFDRKRPELYKRDWIRTRSVRPSRPCCRRTRRRSP